MTKDVRRHDEQVARQGVCEGSPRALRRRPLSKNASTLSAICRLFRTITITITSITRGDARLSIFVAHHLAPLARTYSTHHPSRTKENQR